MNKLRMLGIGLFGIFLVLQLFHEDHTNPKYEANIDFLISEKPPLEVINIIKTACYDCHSYRTEYPWYSNIAPFSWWIGGHIDHAREELNFSQWTTYTEKKKQHKLKEMIEEVDEGNMPLPAYIWMHPEAKLNAQQIETLTSWVKSIQK